MQDCQRYVQRFYQQVYVYRYLLRFVRFYTYDVLSVQAGKEFL